MSIHGVVLKKDRWKHLVLIANRSEQQYKFCFVFLLILLNKLIELYIQMCICSLDYVQKLWVEKHTQLSCRSAVVRRWRNGARNPLLGIIRQPSMLRHSVLVSSRPSAYTHVSATGAILAKHPHLQSMAGSVEFQRRAVDGMNPRSTFWGKWGTGGGVVLVCSTNG